jgi:hypothetical protein
LIKGRWEGAVAKEGDVRKTEREHEEVNDFMLAGGSGEERNLKFKLRVQ